jgi:hypothetical protein
VNVVRLSLISHTNVGKTTLARTLLKRDVGVVRDAAHVTEVAERHVLIEAPEGHVLELWDTPGFGDSARLLRRLRQSGNALGWFLTQVWDRYTDRPFFSSQQAMLNVRDTADVVLYLVNASEDPAAAGYVAAEMEILGWTGKPVVVLLNQLGPPQPPEIAADDSTRWSRHLSAFPCVRDVVAFDAFARCWVQEETLLARIEAALPAEQRASFEALRRAWSARNVATYAGALAVLARHLAAAATDLEQVPSRSLAQSARAWIGDLARGEARPDPLLEAAQAALARRLDDSLLAATNELVALHGLSGRAAAEIGERMVGAYAIDATLDVGKASVLGGALSGALGGLAADLAAGGLTFGAGALLGGLIGAAGAHGLARAFNVASGRDSTQLRWSADFLTGRVTAAVLRYLAVAHFGRGRGDYVQSEYPPHWRALVEGEVASRRGAFEVTWVAAVQGEPAPELTTRLEGVLREVIDAVLRVLYPRGGASG